MRPVHAFCQLFGGVNMSFYDWYADLPTSFPEIWGDQTDVCESADWYNSKFIVSMAANMNMTRTPDVHFIAEARTEGTKFVVLSPDFSQIAQVLLTNGFRSRQDRTPRCGWRSTTSSSRNTTSIVRFRISSITCKRYTDLPFLVELEPDGNTYKTGRLLRAKRVARYQDVENGDWKMLVIDEKSGEPRAFKGQVGDRWGSDARQVESVRPRTRWTTARSIRC